MVLAVWFLTFIPIQVSFSQNQPVVQFSEDRVLLGLNQEPTVINLSLNTSQQVGSWKFFDSKSRSKFLDSLEGDSLFFNATIAGNTVRFERIEQRYGKASVTIAAMRPGNGGELTRGQIEVIAYKVQIPKDYVSFVRERKVNLKLSTLPKSQTGDIEWYFRGNGDAKLLDTELFSALITDSMATFRHKRQQYGEMTVTVVAAKSGQPNSILAEEAIPVFIDDIKIPNDYVSFYHTQKGKVRVNLDLDHNNAQGQDIKWYLLSPRGDKLINTDQDFFSATIMGNGIEFEAVREESGESMVTVAATKTFSSEDPTHPQQDVNIAEKQINVIVPSEGGIIRKVAKLFRLLKSRNSFISLIIKGGDIMLILIILFLAGLTLSIERIMFLFLQWVPGDMNKKDDNQEEKDRLGRTNLSIYAKKVIGSAGNISSDDDNLKENNPVARVFKVGVKAKEKHSSRDIIRENMEAEIERQEEEELSKYTRAIEVFNVLAPMVGFFGTIVGLVGAFMDWTNSAIAGENIKVEDLAGGMYQAMITTAGGLVVAIVVSALLGVILYRIRKFTRVMLDSKDQMLEALVAASGNTAPPAGGGGGNGGNGNDNNVQMDNENSGYDGNTGRNDRNAKVDDKTQDTAQRQNMTNRRKKKNNRKLKVPGIFALTDIVMNLFIFFFIAFNLIAAFKTDKESNIKDVSIPRTTESPSTPAIIKPVRVTIQKDKTVLLDRTTITPAELTRAVRPALEQNNNMPDYEELPNQEVPSVIIAADEEVEYNFVMEVLNAVKDSGLLKIGLTSIPKES